MLNKFFCTLVLLFFLQFTHAQNVPGYLGKKAFAEYQLNSPLLFYLGDAGSSFMHEIKFNYVARRRGVFGIGFETYSFEGTTNEPNRFVNYTSTIKGNSLNLHYDLYIRNSIAPVGSYVRFEFKYLFGEFDDITTSPFGSSESGKYSIPHVNLGYGIRRVFFDFIVFNVGGSVGANNTSFDPIGYEQLLQKSFVFRLNIGAGILLF